jgi:hypothetical protein
MTIKLEEFRLETYKERELLVVALMLYAIHRPEEMSEPAIKEAIEALENRLATQPRVDALFVVGQRILGE